MLSQIARADRPVSCANIICLLRNTAVDCRCGITLCGLEPDHPDCEVRVLRGDKEAWLPHARRQAQRRNCKLPCKRSFMSKNT